MLVSAPNNALGAYQQHKSSSVILRPLAPTSVQSDQLYTSLNSKPLQALHFASNSEIDENILNPPHYATWLKKAKGWAAGLGAVLTTIAIDPFGFHLPLTFRILSGVPVGVAIAGYMFDEVTDRISDKIEELTEYDFDEDVAQARAKVQQSTFYKLVILRQFPEKLSELPENRTRTAKQLLSTYADRWVGKNAEIGATSPRFCQERDADILSILAFCAIQYKHNQPEDPWVRQAGHLKAFLENISTKRDAAHLRQTVENLMQNAHAEHGNRISGIRKKLAEFKEDNLSNSIESLSSFLNTRRVSTHFPNRTSFLFMMKSYETYPGPDSVKAKLYKLFGLRDL